jgi:hypothetical protein
MEGIELQKARHDKVMEGIELQKAKKHKLEYTMELVDKYETMKSKGWSNNNILRLVTDMKEKIEAQENDSISESD